MFQFVPLLTVNPSTQLITSHSHPRPALSQPTLTFLAISQQHLRNILQPLQQSFTIKRDTSQGLYISSVSFNGHFLLYLECQSLEEKHQRFLERVALSSNGKIVVGDGLRVLSRQVFLYLKDNQQLVRVECDEGGGMQMGVVSSIQQILGCVESPSQPSTTGDPSSTSTTPTQLLSEVSSYFSHPAFQQTSNLNSLAEAHTSILKAIKFRREYGEFKAVMIDRSTSMLKKDELNTLLCHVESLVLEPDWYLGLLVSHCKEEIRARNESRREQLLEEVFQRYMAINGTTYEQYKMEMSVKAQLIKYSLDQYLDNGSTCASSLLYKISTEFNTLFYERLKDQFETEKETKECLANEVDQQIEVVNSLKRETERLNSRIKDLCSIDEVLREKEQVVRALQVRNDELSSTGIALEAQILKRDNSLKQLKEQIEYKNQSEIQFLEQIRLKNQQIQRLENSEKQLQILNQDLCFQVKKKADEANHMRKIFHTSHQAKLILDKKVESQEKCLKAFNDNFEALKATEKTKANFVIGLNLAQHREVQANSHFLKGQIVCLENLTKSLTSENKKLKTQVLYFQKAYNQQRDGQRQRERERDRSPVSQPLIVIQENIEPSSDRLRVIKDCQEKGEEKERSIGSRSRSREMSRDQNVSREEGKEWCESSRKEHQRSIASTYKLGEILEGKNKYF